MIESFISNLSKGQVWVIGPELVYGKIYDQIGFSRIKEELFRHLVISRLAYPGSKLKMIDYLNRYQGVSISVDRVYIFLDKLHNRLKTKVKDISFENTRNHLKGNLAVVFYDLTTLHFESSDKDNFRRTGFSKVGKHPQIYLGLLVGLMGCPIGYDIFEGNIYEGHILIPMLKNFESRFNLSRPIIAADSGLLSSKNITHLEEEGYSYILGARIKKKSKKVKEKIMKFNLLN